MSSRRGSGKPLASGHSDPQKGKSVSEVSDSQVEQLGQVVADMALNSTNDDGGWETIVKKSKNRAGSSAAKQWGVHNPNQKAWGNQSASQKQGVRSNTGSGWAAGGSWPTQSAEFKRPVGRGNGRFQSVKGSDNIYVASQPAIQPPLEHGWNWKSRSGSNLGNNSGNGQGNNESIPDRPGDEDEEENDVDEDSDVLDDTDDEFLSDDYDSDASQKSHDTRKKSRWFKKFFEILDELSVEEINDPERQWHCPACQGGPGAIDWYRGLQPLMTHAKTKGSKRVRVHRVLAELLDEELRRRGTSILPAGEAYGQWHGLRDGEKDRDIVWPPMVVIMNTRLDKDDNDKWIGMGNQELLEYFSSFDAKRARHSYGPQGHRGISVLIFESSARGYLEAERLHKHFADQGTNRNAWEKRRVLFHSGGKRQLYGFLAEKEDLDIFNQHCQGKAKLKFELRSYQEMVVKQIRQMSEDNQQLIWLKNKVVKEKMHSKALEESLTLVSGRLRKTMEDNQIVMERTKIQHEENQEAMAFQEEFFRNQIKNIHQAREAKENDFELQQQEKRDKVKQLNANTSNAEEYKRRAEEVKKFIQLQDKEIEMFVKERDELVKVHEDRFAAMKKRHWEEEVELEKQFDAELTCLMEKYSASRTGDNATNS